MSYEFPSESTLCNLPECQETPCSRQMPYLKFKDAINPSQLIICTNVIFCSRLLLWGGYFIYFKFTRVSSIIYQSLHLRKIEETKWLIYKGMCVHLFDAFKHLLLRKTDMLHLRISALFMLLDSSFILMVIG